MAVTIVTKVSGCFLFATIFRERLGTIGWSGARGQSFPAGASMMHSVVFASDCRIQRHIGSGGERGPHERPSCNP